MNRTDDCNAWLFSAMENFRQSKLHEAAADCIMVLARQPEHSEALAMLGGAYLIASRGQGGHAFLDRAAAGPANPVIFAIATLLQNTLVVIIDRHLADKRLSEAVDVLTKFRNIAHCLGRPWTASPLYDRQLVLGGSLLEKIRGDLESGRADLCMEAVGWLLALEPEHAEGAALAARAEYARGDIAATLKWLAKIPPAVRAVHVPDHLFADVMVRIRLVLAEALRNERLEEASAICDLLLRIDPELEIAKLCQLEVGNIAPLIFQRLLQEEGREKILAMVMQLRSLDPKHPALADALGRLFMAERDPENLYARLPALGGSQLDPAPRGQGGPGEEGRRKEVRTEWSPPIPPDDDLNFCIDRMRYYYSFGPVPDHFMYNHGETILEWLNMPRELVLNTEFMHSTGISTLATTLDMVKKGKVKGPYLVFNKRLKRELEQHGVECHLMGTPYVHFRRMREITPAADAAGTLVCPCPLPYDKDAFIDQLLALEERFHPIAISLTPHQIQEREHFIYTRRGLKVVTAGHMYDPMFMRNLYGIMRQYKYTASNGIATTFVISVEMGIPFFYVGDGQPLMLDDPLQVEAWKLILDNGNRPVISPEMAAFVKEVHGCDDPDIDRELLRSIIWKGAVG